MGSVLKVGVGSLAVACLLVGSACSDSAADSPDLEIANSGEPATNSPGLPSELGVTAQADLPCPGNLVDPPPDFKRVLDVVALPASPDYPNALQTSARDAEDGTVYYFAKTGLWWRGDAGFEIEVPVELRSKMAIGWGGPAQPAHVVRADCKFSDSWMVLPGGYWVREPICADVIVRLGTAEQRVPIGLGVPCDGQQPPAGPSDG